jgi:hypothetical protein
VHTMNHHVKLKAERSLAETTAANRISGVTP